MFSSWISSFCRTVATPFSSSKPNQISKEALAVDSIYRIASSDRPASTPIVILGYFPDDRCKMKLSLDIESKCIEKIEKQNLVEKLLEMNQNDLIWILAGRLYTSRRPIREGNSWYKLNYCELAWTIVKRTESRKNTVWVYHSSRRFWTLHRLEKLRFLYDISYVIGQKF